MRSWLIVLTLAAALPPAAAAQSRVLEGRVVDAATGAPVAGAMVRSGAGSVVVSSADGTWRIPLAVAATLTVEHVAYAAAHVQTEAFDGTGPLVVRLTPRPVSLDALVVTASRRSQRLADVPVATEVIGRTALRETGASDLAAVLTEQTGIAAQGGHPVGAGVMMQGLGAERVLVLLDGQPWIGRLSGSQDLSRLPTSSIERVEIVKGPQSTLYGSEAMGGVVNVITRPPLAGAWNGGLDVRGGSRGRLDVAGDVRGGDDALGVAVNAGRRTIELVPGLDEDAGTFATRWDGRAAARWRATDALTVDASAYLLDERQRWRSGQIYRFADNVQWGGRAGGVWRSGVHTLTPTLHATEFRHRARQSTRPDPVAGSGEREVQRLLEVELLYALDAGPVVLDGGVELSRESITSDRVRGTDRVLHAAEPFAQVTWTRGPVSVVPGARLSWSEQWGAHWTPRVAALFRPAERVALRAALGAGYRAPDFKELYMEFLNVGPGFGYVVRGNPDARPEVSRNLSGSIEWAGDRLYARVQAFHNRFDDFIETREVGDSSGITVFTYGNIEDGTTRGADLEAGTTFGALRAEAGWSWLSARRADTGERLLGRPARSGRASLAWTTSFGLRASATALHSGRTPVRRDGETLVEREAFTRLDLRIAHTLPGALELSLGIDNVADVRPLDWPGFLGRQIHLGAAWRIGRADAASTTDPSRE